jgi:uncharacterized protein (UPF0218 family)
VDAVTDSRDDVAVSLSLPTALRSAFKEPFGPVETDTTVLLESVDGPLIAVGDIVTYHFLEAGRPPDVGVVDERTKRARVDDHVHDAVVTPDVTVLNPAGEITGDLVVALGDAVAGDEPTTILVDGEEDLAVLPAVMVAPLGATVVYGQPDEGMVRVPVTADVRSEFRALIDRMDGDTDAFWELVDDVTASRSE